MTENIIDQVTGELNRLSEDARLKSMSAFSSIEYASGMADAYKNAVDIIYNMSHCRIEPDPDDPDVEKPYYRCTSCGYSKSLDDWMEWNFCPVCGNRRKERV